MAISLTGTPKISDKECRIIRVPICSDRTVSPTADTPAIGEFNKPVSDVLDFSVDLGDWLEVNGNVTISNAVWARAAGSPASNMVISSQGFSRQGMATIVLSGGVAGEVEWFDVTFTVDAVTAACPGGVDLPARTIVRRIYITVVS